MEPLRRPHASPDRVPGATNPPGVRQSPPVVEHWPSSRRGAAAGAHFLFGGVRAGALIALRAHTGMAATFVSFRIPAMDGRNLGEMQARVDEGAGPQPTLPPKRAGGHATGSASSRVWRGHPAMGVGGLAERRSGACNPPGGAATGWRVWIGRPRLTGAGKGPERVCPKKFSPFAQIQFFGKGVPEGGVQRGKLAGKTGFAAHRPPRSGINGMMGSAILPDTVWGFTSGCLCRVIPCAGGGQNVLRRVLTVHLPIHRQAVSMGAAVSFRTSGSAKRQAVIRAFARSGRRWGEESAMEP
jgi:hypothetical protein